MAARRGLTLLPSILKSADLPLLASLGSRSAFTTLRYGAPVHARPAIAARSIWSSFKPGGFSSSSAQQQDGKPAADGDPAASTAAGEQEAAEGAAASGEAAQEPSAEELKAALLETQAALEEEHKKAVDMKEKLVRTLADMENLRERTARQTSEARQFAVQSLVKDLVDVADNLERAAGSVSMADVDGTNEVDKDRALSLLRGLREGVVMTDGMLMKVLGKEGVQRYDPLGEAFDPNLHSALFQVPDATKEPGTVAVVVKKGYLLHDRAVRAAEVGVVSKVEHSE